MHNIEIYEKYFIKTPWYAGKGNDYDNNPPEFVGHSLVNIDGNTAYDFFKEFFNDDLLDIFVFESNRYALQTGKENFKLSKKELKVFLGINIVMTYIHYPRLRMYWSSVRALRFDLIADAISVNRFEEIQRYLHFVDNENILDDDKQNRFWKLKPIIDSLHDSFHKGQENEEHLAIDEMMIPFKGKHSAKQYIKNKPKKWGFKMWVRASRQGYVYCFELYSGKKSVSSPLGPVADTVLGLCHDIKGKNHKLFMDNFFTSLPLLKKLKEDNIYVLGTVRINRARDAAVKLVPGKLLNRGMCSVTTSCDNISVLRWKDNREVHTVSTYAAAFPEGEVKRYDRKLRSVVMIPRPFAIKEYNSFMGGVDMADRMIAHYPHGLKSKKWYLRIFFHLLNVSIINAWLCYQKKIDKTVDLLTFKSSIANSLILQGTCEDKKRGRPSLSPTEGKKKKKICAVSVIPEIQFDNVGHWPKKSNKEREQRCRHTICNRRTRYMCGKCKVHICPDCMEDFHSK